ncbi:MAG TPA: peroxiredoxin-like family protein [Polyangiaceae bacterium]|jgi:hypothetical protein|nr:peroxiredoxin-like family protein [Polyangiaceae bacterium]
MTSPASLLDAAHADRLVAQIAAAPVMTLEGSTTRIRELWRENTTVTSFVRHFGCLFCHQMVHDLVATVPAILRRGGHVVIVGNGTIEQARYFFSMKQLPRAGVSVVTDPERESYRAAGFERGVVRTLVNPGSARAYANARRHGFRVKGIFGDLTQLGGLMVVKPPTSLVFFHKSRFAGDHPNMNDVLAAFDD